MKRTLRHINYLIATAQDQVQAWSTVGDYHAACLAEQEVRTLKHLRSWIYANETVDPVTHTPSEGYLP